MRRTLESLHEPATLRVVVPGQRSVCLIERLLPSTSRLVDARAVVVTWADDVAQHAVDPVGDVVVDRAQPIDQIVAGVGERGQRLGPVTEPLGQAGQVVAPGSICCAARPSSTSGCSSRTSLRSTSWS